MDPIRPMSYVIDVCVGIAYSNLFCGFEFFSPYLDTCVLMYKIVEHEGKVFDKEIRTLYANFQ